MLRGGRESVSILECERRLTGCEGCQAVCGCSLSGELAYGRSGWLGEHECRHFFFDFVI